MLVAVHCHVKASINFDRTGQKTDGTHYVKCNAMPLPKLYATKRENSAQMMWSYLGPFPWLVIADAQQTDLYLYHFVSALLVGSTHH